MEIAIGGGHGKIALLLGKQLAERGDAVIGLIREGDDDVAEAISGAEAVVFAAYLRAKAEHLDRGDIPRADVAAVLAAVLEARNAIGETFDVVSGEEAVAAI